MFVGNFAPTDRSHVHTFRQGQIISPPSNTLQVEGRRLHEVAEIVVEPLL